MEPYDNWKDSLMEVAARHQLDHKMPTIIDSRPKMKCVTCGWMNAPANMDLDLAEAAHQYEEQKASGLMPELDNTRRWAEASTSDPLEDITETIRQLKGQT